MSDNHHSSILCSLDLQFNRQGFCDGKHRYGVPTPFFEVNKKVLLLINKVVSTDTYFSLPLTYLVQGPFNICSHTCMFHQ